MESSKYLVYLQKIKNDLKQDYTMLEILAKYKMDPDDLDLIPIKFDDIDVSAKTDRGVITLNWSLLDKENIKDIPSYIVHETNHYCQQATEPTQSADDGDYLSNPFEQESFQYQIKYIDEHQGEQKAREYTEQVLDHHQEKGKERDKKHDILLKKIETFSRNGIIK